MSSQHFGLGPKWWQRKGNKLKKCSERKSKWCDPTETDGCCAIIACTYCLELEIYGEAVQYGTAEFATDGWFGTVGGYTFFAFWEKNYEGICEFVVQFNGEEVYRKDCNGGQSCRDSSDEAEVVIPDAYDVGTLRWVKYLSRPLPYVRDPDTGCKTWFCGECECSCECLCVTISDYSGLVTVGEICDNNYNDDCEGPVWEGTVGYYFLSLALIRDEYTGECKIVPTVDGYEQDPVSVTGCGDMTAEFTLDTGETVTIQCKKCLCEEFCAGSCWPIDRTLNPNELKDIPWTISAPSCAAIDGATGTFTPLGFRTDWMEGLCGPCVCYEDVTVLNLPGKIKLEVGGDDGDPETVDPPASCIEQDCTIQIKLYLATGTSTSGCCNVSVVVELLSVVDGLALNAGESQNQDTLNCIPQVSPVDDERFRQFNLDSCECLPDDAGFVGLLDLSRISWYCKLGNATTGACIGQPLCCVLFGCSLSGATLSL